MNKTAVIGLSVLSVILVLGTTAPVFAATPNSRPYGKLGKGLWVTATDGFGNVFAFQRRHGVGQITSSPYLQNIPWSITYTQPHRSNNFAIDAIDPVSGNGDCSFQYSGSFTSATTASGTWENTTCSGSGTFTMTAGTGGVVITTTGGKPGVAS